MKSNLIKSTVEHITRFDRESMDISVHIMQKEGETMGLKHICVAVKKTTYSVNEAK